MDAAFVELDPEIGQIHPGVVPPPQQNELEVISQEEMEAYQAKQNRLLRWSNHLLGAPNHFIKVLKVLEFKVLEAVRDYLTRKLNERGGGEAAGKRAREPPEVEEDDRANKRPRGATNSEPTYAGADSRSGTSSSEKAAFNAGSTATRVIHQHAFTAENYVTWLLPSQLQFKNRYAQIEWPPGVQAVEEPFTAAVRKASFAAQCVVDGHWRTVGEMLVTAQYLPEAATHGLWVASIEYIYVLPRFHRKGVASALVRALVAKCDVDAFASCIQVGDALLPRCDRASPFVAFFVKCSMWRPGPGGGPKLRESATHWKMITTPR
jgi:GNAT superfamily N-acetyltransferase